MMKVFISTSARKPDPKKYTWFKAKRKVTIELAIADADAEFKRGDEFGIRTLRGKTYILDRDDLSEHFQIDESEHKHLMKYSQPLQERVEFAPAPKRKPKASALIDPLTIKDGAGPLFSKKALPKDLITVYDKSAYGIQGKRGSRTTVVVGIAYFKSKLEVLAAVLNSRGKIVGISSFVKPPYEFAKSMQNSSARRQLSYAAFLSIRDKAANFVKELDDSTTERQAKSDKVANDFKSKLAPGATARLRWDKGMPSWHKILMVDHRNSKIAIQGSRSKKRWIPFSYITDIKD